MNEKMQTQEVSRLGFNGINAMLEEWSAEDQMSYQTCISDLEKTPEGKIALANIINNGSPDDFVNFNRFKAKVDAEKSKISSERNMRENFFRSKRKFRIGASKVTRGIDAFYTRL